MRIILGVLLLGLAMVPAFAQDREQALHRYRRGLERYQKGQLDAAIADFTAVIQMGIVDVDGRKRAREGGLSFAQALKTGKPIVMVDSLLANAFADRALARYRQGDASGALQDCDQALSLNPGLVRAHNNRGMVLWSSGHLDGAVEEFNYLIEVNPRDAIAYHSRGYVRLQQVDIPAALADFNRAIALSASNADFYCDRGVALRLTGRLEQALGDLNKGLELNPGSAWLHYYRGLVWEDKNELRLAIADLGEAIKIDPRFAPAYAHRASIFIKLGETVDAETDFKDCQRLAHSLKECWPAIKSSDSPE